jgi:hypothetical protein
VKSPNFLTRCSASIAGESDGGLVLTRKECRDRNR